MKNSFRRAAYRAIPVIMLMLLGCFAIEGRVRAACEETAGRTERSQYQADIIQTRMYYTVYLPPCYDQSEDTYPVVYLMHGSNEDDNHWLRLGLAEALDAGITAGDMPNVIVVLPFANWIGNENRFEADSWGSIFLNQMMPLVEQQYRINPSRDTRAIGGISRGGFWAFHLALRNPALFGAVGGHSAFFDRYHAPADHNPLDLAADAPGAESLRIWLDRGRDDFAAPGLDIMQERLTERGLEFTYMIYPEGQHNNAYWSQHIGEYLQFYTSEWPDESSAEAEVAVTETPAPEVASTTDGIALFVPVVVFPSLQATISMDRLETIRVGLLDTQLVLSESVVEALGGYGIVLPVGTQIVPDDSLYNTLWRNRDLFTLLPFNQLTPRFRMLNVDEQPVLDHELALYPFAFASDAPNFYDYRLTRFLLSGVTALTRDTRSVLDSNGIEWAGEAILPYVSTADFFHTSNEVSIHPTCPQSDGVLLGGSFSFCSKAEHFELLTYLGLEIVELSGNHNNDYGYDAYRETLQWYADRGIMTVGGGETLEAARRPVLLYHNNNTIAMIACNWVGPYYALVNEDLNATGGVRPGAAACDLNWLREALPRLAAENDVLIVTVQYWEYDQFVPTDQQRFDFRTLAELGADVVIGTQAHFPQTYEFYNVQGTREAFIHYGLGNLFFDQQFFGGVRFLMDQLFIYEGRLLTVDVFTGLIEGQGRPRPMTPDERENFLFLMFNEYGGI